MGEGMLLLLLLLLMVVRLALRLARWMLVGILGGTILVSLRVWEL